MESKIEKTPVCKCVDAAPNSVNTALQKRQGKFKHQQKTLKTVIQCGCGNNIRMFNEKTEVKCFNCNNFWDKIDGEWKFRRRQKTLKTVLQCDCGNSVRMFNDKTEVKCFNCNHFWDKVNGKWEKSEKAIGRNTYTIGDAVNQAKKEGTVTIGAITLKVRKK